MNDGRCEKMSQIRFLFSIQCSSFILHFFIDCSKKNKQLSQQSSDKDNKRSKKKIKQSDTGFPKFCNSFNRLRIFRGLFLYRTDFNLKTFLGLRRYLDFMGYLEKSLCMFGTFKTSHIFIF